MQPTTQPTDQPGAQRTLPDAAAATARLRERLGALGAAGAGFGRTFKDVDGVPVPALLVFARPEHRAAAPGLDEFEGFPLVWCVAAAA